MQRLVFGSALVGVFSVRVDGDGMGWDGGCGTIVVDSGGLLSGEDGLGWRYAIHGWAGWW